MRRIVLGLLLALAAALVAAWLYEPVPDEPLSPRDLRFLGPATEEAPNPSEGPAAAECTTVLRARFLDAAGNPVEGVRLTCAWPRASATSGADGRVTLALALLARSDARTLYLRAIAAGYASVAWTARAKESEVTDLGDVLLGPAGRVRGRVLDESGRGVAVAEVRAVAGLDDGGASALHGPSDSVTFAATDAQGHFELDGVPVGPVRIWAGSPSSYWSASDPFEVAPGAVLGGIELVIRPIPAENVLELAVVDPDGAPVPGAAILYRREGGRGPASGQGVADERGRWRLIAEDRVAHELRAIDPDATLRAGRISGVVPGSGEVVIALSKPRTLRIAVRDDSDEPIARFRVLIAEESSAGTLPELAFPEREREQGILETSLPLEPFTLELAAEGFRSASFGPFEPERCGEEIAVTLAALPRLRGIVHHDGEPIAQARVGLFAAAPRELELTINGFPSRSEPKPLASAATNARGEFALVLPATGDYYIRASADGWSAADAGPIAIETERELDGLHLELMRGGALEGEVRVDPGETVEGRIVALSRGDGLPFTVRTDPAGRFRVEQLTPGAWWVGPAERELAPGSFQAQRAPRSVAAAIPTNCTVMDGEVTRVSVSFEVRLRSIVRGALALGGRPTAGWQVQVTLAGAANKPPRRAVLDEAGRFTLGTAEPGPHVLSFHDPARGAEVLTLDCRVELAEGEQSWRLDLPIGRVQGRTALLARRTERVEWRAQAADGILAHGVLQYDAEGNFLLPRVPAGEVTLLRRDGSAELLLRTFQLPAGATFDLDL